MGGSNGTAWWEEEPTKDCLLVEVMKFWGSPIRWGGYDGDCLLPDEGDEHGCVGMYEAASYGKPSAFNLLRKVAPMNVELQKAMLVKTLAAHPLSSALFACARAARYGALPMFEIGIPAAAGIADSDSNGNITISTALTWCESLDALIFELANVAQWKKFEELRAAAAAGHVSREFYMRGNEYIESITRHTACVIREECKASWGCENHKFTLQPSEHNLDTQIALLIPYHRQHYEEQWDQSYRSAYEQNSQGL